MDQVLETILLDSRSEYRTTHCLVIPSPCNESLNMLRVEPCPFAHALNEDLSGTCYLLGIALGDGSTEMSKHRIYLKEISGNSSRVEDGAMCQGGRQLEVD